MADTLPNVALPRNVWVDIYAETGISPGTKIVIENLGSAPVQLVVSASQPSGPRDPDGFQRLQPRSQKINQSGDSGVWARSHQLEGLVNVFISG